MMPRTLTDDRTAVRLSGPFAMAALVFMAATCGALAAERGGTAATSEQTRVPPSPARPPAPATAAPSRPLSGLTPGADAPTPPSAPIVTPSLRFIGAGPLSKSAAVTVVGAGGAAPVARPSGGSKPIVTEQLRFIGVGK
jgi:hypothetical protein